MKTAALQCAVWVSLAQVTSFYLWHVINWHGECLQCSALSSLGRCHFSKDTILTQVCRRALFDFHPHRRIADSYLLYHRAGCVADSLWKLLQARVARGVGHCSNVLPFLHSNFDIFIYIYIYIYLFFLEGDVFMLVGKWLMEEKREKIYSKPTDKGWKIMMGTSQKCLSFKIFLVQWDLLD